MPDVSAFLNALKQQAVSAAQAAGPVNVQFGTVLSVNPLKIQVDQTTILQPAELILSRNVTDYTCDVTTVWETEAKGGGSGEASFSSHTHSIAGKKQITIQNGLKAGEKVVLLQMQGGQRSIVLDRVVSI